MTDSHQHYEGSPLWASLQVIVAVARHHGVELHDAALLHHYNLAAEPISIAQMLRMFGDNKLRSKRKQLNWRSVTNLGEAYPAILQLRDGHFVILAGARPNPSHPETMQLAVLDPMREAEGFIFIGAHEYDEMGAGEVILVKRGYGRIQEQRTFDIAWFMFSFWRERALFGNILIAAVLLLALSLVTPLFFQIVVDKVLVHNSTSTLTVLGIGVVVVVFFEEILSFLRGYLLLYAANRIDVQLAGKTFSHLLSLPLYFFESSSSGVLTKHMQQAEPIREFVSGRLFLSLLDALALFVFLPLLLSYSMIMGGVVLAFSLVVALVILSVMPTFNHALKNLYKAEGERQAMLVETIHGMRTVKSLTLEPRQNRKWLDRTASAILCRFRVGKISNIARAVIGLSDKLLTVVIVWLGAHLVFAGKLSVGELVAIQMLAGRVSQPLAALASLVSEFQQTTLSVKMLGEVMNRAPERPSSSANLRPLIEGRIDCEDMGFTYPLAPSPALQDIKLHIPAGSTVGIVGRSGSGKSTFTRLLQGLYQPGVGHIRFDGVDLREIDLAHLRRHIGVVLQESFLFAGSIRDNIAASRPTASFAEIVAAARVAGADEFIRDLPQGYDTVLEENATNLSGGQKQRIAIARALLPEPPVMIFDEATSALDPESEAIVQDNLSAIAAGRTFIAISHRLTTLVHCDQILVFDRGRIIHAGTHEQLLKESELYQQLWHQQTKHMITGHAS